VYCGQQEPIVDSLEKEYAGRIVIKRLNTYEAANVPLAQRYGITGVPAVVLLDPSGKLLARWIGLTEAGRLRQGIASAGVK
jgi:thioredoxin-like negative regulator of GroEL